MRALLTLGGAIAAAMISLSAAHADDPAKVGQTSLGPTLTDQNGLTLYTYTRDMVGYSNCNGDCATAWPPLPAAASATASGDWTIVVRDDGKRQWAYKGHALYTFSKDAKAGDVTGDGADGGKWHAAKP